MTSDQTQDRLCNLCGAIIPKDGGTIVCADKAGSCTWRPQNTSTLEDPERGAAVVGRPHPDEAYRQGWLDRKRFDETPREIWDGPALDRLERMGLL